MKMKRTCGSVCIAIGTEAGGTETCAGVGVGVGAEGSAAEATAKRHGGGFVAVAVGGFAMLRRSRKMTRQTREDGAVDVLCARRYDRGMNRCRVRCGRDRSRQVASAFVAIAVECWCRGREDVVFFLGRCR